MLEQRCLLSGASSSVVGRFIFYDNSHYDGNTPGVDSSDDSAIATDKSAFLSGPIQATFASVTSYSRGINGIMVDISGSHPAITANDFTFKVGNNNMPSSWATAPPPTMVAVRAGSGVSGSDRVEIVWADKAIQNEWLEISVDAEANTGLGANDVFFFGNEIGDTGLSNSVTVAKVGAADITAVQNHVANLNANIPVTNLFDVNRDGQVGAGDITFAQTHGTTNSTGLQFLKLFSTPPPVLSAGLANDTGVSNTDGITSDPTISGTLAAPNGIAIFTAALDTSGAQTVNMAWSTVGNPGNAGDTTVMKDGTTGYGSVGYTYSIGTYDVTNSQYAEFLNAKDPTGANTLGLWNSSMALTTSFGFINYNSGAPNGSKYSVTLGDGDYPVVNVNWYDAVRFANWLNNGQGNGDTESGAYTLLGGTPTPSNGLTVTRNAAATVFLPNQNEWYKAAFYNPGTNSYFQYPTGSDSTPIASFPTSLPNHANFYPGGPYYPTNVGAYTGTTSPYGAFDMGGNAWQWTETLFTGSVRGVRGCQFKHQVSDMVSSMQVGGAVPDYLNDGFGFRVATLRNGDVLPLVQSNGTFTLSSSLLATLNGGPLADGSHVLHLQAADDSGLTAAVDVPFTLKTSVATPSLPVLISSNTNNVTNINTPTIAVTAETGSLVQLLVDNVQVAQGTATAGLQFTLGAMADGTYQITATSTDVAGNSATSPTLSITINTSQPSGLITTLASFPDDRRPHLTVTAGGPDLSAVASSLAAPAVLSPPQLLQQPSTTSSKASDYAVAARVRDDSADSIMEDWPWLEPNRMADRDSNSSNTEATDFVLGSLAGESLL